ncbi:hypothetical protein V5F89_01220 [Pelagerythrobacter marensis]|uniref:Uncharacterized protein n=1 Tax=Pelagerythrobacter marensis TaxID=543877 RepID=A0ABZ2D6W8_9SPHN
MSINLQPNPSRRGPAHKTRENYRSEFAVCPISAAFITEIRALRTKGFRIQDKGLAKYPNTQRRRNDRTVSRIA